jgi:hypothetical protein
MFDFGGPATQEYHKQSGNGHPTREQARRLSWRSW